MDYHYSTVLVVILLQPNHITEFFDIHQDILQSHEIIPYIWGELGLVLCKKMIIVVCIVTIFCQILVISSDNEHW